MKLNLYYVDTYIENLKSYHQDPDWFCIKWLFLYVSSMTPVWVIEVVLRNLYVYLPTYPFIIVTPLLIYSPFDPFTLCSYASLNSPIKMTKNLAYLRNEWGFILNHFIPLICMSFYCLCITVISVYFLLLDTYTHNSFFWKYRHELRT